MTLDDAYANAPYIVGAQTFPPKWDATAAAFRKALGARAEQNISYGPSIRQAVDFFHAEGTSNGTLIFVHGGYWKAFDRTAW